MSSVSQSDVRYCGAPIGPGEFNESRVSVTCRLINFDQDRLAMPISIPLRKTRVSHKQIVAHKLHALAKLFPSGFHRPNRFQPCRFD